MLILRTKRALYITVTGIVLQLTRSIMSLVIRKIFLDTLGAELLGLNSLFSSILGFLTLTELGIGAAINVYLYEALAKEDYEKASAYLRLLRKAYRIVCAVVIIGGTLCIPLMLKLVKGDYDLKQIIIAYFLYILATVASYLWAETKNIFMADQREYVSITIMGIVYVVVSVMQIVCLYVTRNYYLFLVLNILNNLASNLIIYCMAHKKYKRILCSKAVLIKDEINAFWIKWKAVIVYNISAYLIQSCDNMIVSVIFGTVMVAYYNNYVLILNMLYAVCATFSSSVMAGLGNMFYTERHRLKQTIDKLSCIQHFIFSVTTVGLICLSSEFVEFIFGKESVLPELFVVMLGLVYYFMGYFNLFESLRKSVGLYEKDQWHLLGTSVLNIIISIAFSYVFGMAGVVIGTLVCYLIKGLYLTPKLIYEKGVLDEGKKSFYINMLKNIVLLAVAIFVSFFALNYIVISNFYIRFVVKGCVGVAITLLINILVYRKSEEWQGMLELLKNKFMKKKA